jgi:hypothetical protein
MGTEKKKERNGLLPQKLRTRMSVWLRVKVLSSTLLHKQIPIFQMALQLFSSAEKWHGKKID